MSSQEEQDVHGGARIDGIGPSDECREPRLEPKHRIFLSHSGAQKDFTWQLCVDLERAQHHPFFDRRDDSLPKGESFPPLILEAARECRIAVLVISDEFFTRSKWPMIELNEFVKAQGSDNQDLKILPLFFGITMEQFRDKKRRARWFKKWKEFACADNKRIDVETWKSTLSKIPGGINAMQYDGAAEGEVAFREKVVQAICKLLPPDVKYDVSHVQSLKQLCEPIIKKLKEVEPSSWFKVKVVGLYGMGGVGKTTISMATCNEMFRDFSGGVCHVELGGNDQVELQKRVLRRVTYAKESILENDPKQLDDLLKQRMHRQEVFLVLDNVWDDQVDEALKYLKAGHHAKSMVLVTSRSVGVLNRLGIDKRNCMETSNLEEKGATDVLLHYSGISRESIIHQRDWDIIGRYVRKCYFARGEIATGCLDEERTYHPLALKVLGSQFFTIKIEDWDETLKGSDIFNKWKDKVHPVFSILGIGFHALPKKLQEIFLDLALLWRSKSIWDGQNDVYLGDRKENILEWEWLCTLHSVCEDEMIANVDAIQRKGLLEKVNDMTKLEYNIHDLYFEFAEVEAQALPDFVERRILLKKGGSDAPQELEEYPPNGSYWPNLKRLIVSRSAVKSLKEANLHHCKNVEVLVLTYCSELEEVDVTGMKNVKLMVVYACKRLGKLSGLATLRNLVYFYRREDPNCESIPIEYVFGSTKLRGVKLRSI